MLNWTEPASPTRDVSHYDHVFAETPLGKAKIEWKSWKDDPDYGVEVGSEYVGTCYGLDEAKDMVETYLKDKSKAINDLESVTMTKEEIADIEEKLQPDGLTGYLYHIAFSDTKDSLFETVYIDGIGACLVIRGEGDVIYRRNQFLEIYDGFKKLSEYFKTKAK